ncbi:MAG: D-alanine--D-alanine ligase [Legionellales bacterium]|nr:D-alanine--D-alanine ligase [Legionellales bacterium]|tara:strand:+ start:287 stop:1228 length:942 start_codon:yes stop_codon:yes gene_type:complete
MRLSEYSVEEYGKVAVLMGGESAEREISLESGKAIYAALLQSGINAHIIDYKSNSFNQLLNNDFDRVFLALHGRGGEDGTVQKKLEAAGLPYTGSNASASALAMDKIKSKSIWHKAGISTPKSIEVNQNTNWQDVAEKIGLPIMIKPVREGSSFGAAKINRMEDLCSAWMNASQFDDRVMAESWVTGNEYTVPILGEKVLPMIKLETKNTFYDYDAKYNDINTKYICPCGLDESFESSLGKISKKACKLLGVSGWARVDLLIDSSNQEWLIEVNTIPGMTSHSLVPMSAKKAGISFEKLVKKILATSFKEDNL